MNNLTGYFISGLKEIIFDWGYCLGSACYLVDPRKAIIPALVINSIDNGISYWTERSRKPAETQTSQHTTAMPHY